MKHHPNNVHIHLGNSPQEHPVLWLSSQQEWLQFPAQHANPEVKVEMVLFSGEVYFPVVSKKTSSGKSSSSNVCKQLFKLLQGINY